MINVTKTKLLPKREQYFYTDAVKEVNKTEISQTDKFKDMAPPHIFCEWRILKGFFELYKNFLLSMKNK